MNGISHSTNGRFRLPLLLVSLALGSFVVLAAGPPADGGWQMTTVGMVQAYRVKTGITIAANVVLPNRCYEARVAALRANAYPAQFVVQTRIRTSETPCASVVVPAVARGSFAVGPAVPSTVLVHAANKIIAVAVEIVPPYPQGPCDMSDVLNVMAGPMKAAPEHSAALIASRIATCRDIIHQYVTSLVTPTPMPTRVVLQNLAGLPTLPALRSPAPVLTEPPQCAPVISNDPMRQYAVLDYCFGWIVRNVASPAILVSPAPPPLAFHTPGQGPTAWTKVIYVLALATDAPTSGQISLQLADDLRDKRFSNGATSDSDNGDATYPRDPYTNQAVRYQVIAEPVWTLAQYQQQCFSDSSTAGAIVVLPPGVQSAAYNVFFSAAWSALSLQALVVDCEPTNTSYVNNAAYVTYITHVRTATGHRYSLSLSTLLAAVSGYLAIHPPRSETFAVWSPSPPPGTTIQTGYMTNVNQSSAAAFAAALNPLSSTNLGQGSGPDVSAQVAGAMAKVLPSLLHDLMGPCPPQRPDYKSPKWTPDLPYATQCRWFKKPDDL